jgi:signal transduction histidine kinase/response regulator of citrate/malate metabolism
MPLKVLLIEDNPDDADLLRETLTAERSVGRVSLIAAETLREGVAHLERASVDLLLLDLSLPDSHGLDTVRRALAHAPRVPIIVLTGLDDDAIGVQAIHAGAQDYLAKGQVDGPLLRRSMHYAIERHRLLAERTDDAQVFAALVRVGEALMAGLHTHTLLDRLCQVTAEVLGCDITSTWVLDEAADAYVPAAANSSEEWERIGSLRVPRSALKPLTNARAADGSVHRLDERLRHRLPEPLVQMPPDIAAEVCLTLRRAGQIMGTQVCGYREGGPEWSGVQDRIAHGLVNVAALALDNAQLVAELEQSNAIKTYFAATMSHELRNTVFAIGGFSEMILEALRRSGSNDPVRLAHMIGERARESQQLIQAALEMTRSEVRPVQPDEREVTLDDLVEPLRHEMDSLCNGRTLTIDWQLAPEVPAMRTDAVKLRMILKNLVSNAIKFTERGAVRVTAKRCGDRVRLTVSDTGLGIPPDELPHVFEPFRQAHGHRSRRAGGAGLGLYIVRRLVDLLGGTIAVDSAAGSGTTFAIELPLVPESGPPAGRA